MATGSHGFHHQSSRAKGIYIGMDWHLGWIGKDGLLSVKRSGSLWKISGRTLQKQFRTSSGLSVVNPRRCKPEVWEALATSIKSVD